MPVITPPTSPINTSVISVDLQDDDWLVHSHALPNWIRG
jgi:hypothetical protein